MKGMFAAALGAILLAGAAPPAPHAAGQPAALSSEARQLGHRLAAVGTFATVATLLTAKETDEMVAAHPELSPAEQAKLKVTASKLAAAGRERVVTAMGEAYAANLDLAELKTLVAFYESPAARRQHEVLPIVIQTAMSGIGAIDLKGETIAQFCRDTGKLCPKP